MNHQLNGTFLGAEKKETTFDFTFPMVDKPLPVVIFCHGFKGFKDWGGFNYIAHQFAEHGIAVFKINFSHNGTQIHDTQNFSDLESFSKNTLQMEMDDIAAAERYIQFELPKQLPNFIPSEIILLGHSKGGVSCLLHAAHQPSDAKKIITWGTPFNFFRSWSNTFLKEWREKGIQYVMNGRTKQQMPLSVSLLDDFEAHRDRYDMRLSLPLVHQPVFIFQGMKDESVSYHNAAEIASYLTQAQVHLLEEANHTFGMVHPWSDQWVPGTLTELIRLSVQSIMK